jgi:hypothetical protein
VTPGLALVCTVLVLVVSVCNLVLLNRVERNLKSSGEVLDLLLRLADKRHTSNGRRS